MPQRQDPTHVVHADPRMVGGRESSVHTDSGSVGHRDPTPRRSCKWTQNNNFRLWGLPIHDREWSKDVGFQFVRDEHGTWLPLHRNFPSGLCNVRGTAPSTILTSNTSWEFTNAHSLPGGSDGKGDPGLIPGSGRSSRSLGREGNGYPFQYSCLENSMDRGTWWVTVQGDMTEWLNTFFKVSLSISNSLASLTGCSESRYTHGYGLFSERIQNKISQGKKYKGQSPGGFQMWAFQWSSPCGVMGSTTFLASMYDYMHGVLPTTAAHWVLMSGIFIRAPSSRQSWLASWLTAVSSPSWR